MRMNKSKNIFFILTITIILAASTEVFSQTPNDIESMVNANNISIEYHGSGWFTSEFQPYLLENTPPALSQYGEKYINQSFPFSLDSSDQSWFAIRYLGHIYRIDISYPTNRQGLPSQDGTNTEFRMTKDGKPCNQYGKTIEKLDLLSNKYIVDFKDQCGISFAANWDTVSFGTEVQIEGIFLTQNEVQRNIKYIIDDAIKNNRAQVIKTANEANNLYRVLELNNINNFQPDPNRVIFVHPDTEYFTKSDDTGKENGIVVTENGKILYFITIMDNVSNNFVVYKPPTDVLVTNYTTYQDLKKEAKLGWLQVAGQQASNLDAILATGAITTPAIANIGGASFSAAVSDAAMSAASFAGRRGIGVAGGIIARSGAAMTVVALTPVGWVILGVAGVSTTVYGVYHFTSTDTYIYDNGKMMMNWDSELFSRLIGGAAAKVNFLFIQKAQSGSPGNPTPLGPEGTVKIHLTNFVQSIKNKFASVDIESYKNLVANPIEGLKSGLTIYKADLAGNKIGDPLNANVTTEGDDTLVISKLQKGQIYAFVVKFIDPYPTDHPEITAAFKVAEVE